MGTIVAIEGLAPAAHLVDRRQVRDVADDDLGYASPEGRAGATGRPAAGGWARFVRRSCGDVVAQHLAKSRRAQGSRDACTMMSRPQSAGRSSKRIGSAGTVDRLRRTSTLPAGPMSGKPAATERSREPTPSIVDENHAANGGALEGAWQEGCAVETAKTRRSVPCQPDCDATMGEMTTEDFQQSDMASRHRHPAGGGDRAAGPHPAVEVDTGDQSGDPGAREEMCRRTCR